MDVTINSLFREPCAVKAAYPVLTGGLGRRTVRSRALILPTWNVALPTHIVSTVRIEEMAVPHVEHKLVFRAMGDRSVGIEAPDHGLAGDVDMHDAWSCTSSLRVIPPPPKPGTMLPYHTIVRGRCHDSALC